MSDRGRGQLYVALAALAWSTAGPIQRNLTADPATQAAGRALFACAAIFAFVAASNRGAVIRAFRSIGRAGLGIAVCVAVSSGSFMLALNLTSVANVLVIQALVPFPAAILGRVFLREPISRRTWLAMLAAVTGVVVMVGGPGGELSMGIAVAALVPVAMASAIVMARHRSDVSMAPATCLAQLFLVLAVMPLAHLEQAGGHDLPLLAALGIGQLGLGLVFLTIGARLIPAAEVALVSLLETVLGPLWVWLAMGEAPGVATLAGGALILAAVAAVALTTGPASRTTEVPILP